MYDLNKLLGSQLSVCGKQKCLFCNIRFYYYFKKLATADIWLSLQLPNQGNQDN